MEIIRNKANQWAKALIDLDYRNTLLNFQLTRSSLDLTGSDPAALGRLLNGNRTNLRALFDTEDKRRDACLRIRDVRRKATAFREEQGIDVGKIACGLIRTDPAKSAGRPTLRLRAPLLLRPVEIHAKTAAENDFTIESDRDVEINLVLLHALQREYGLDFPIDELAAKINNFLAELVDVEEQTRRAFEELSALGARHGVVLDFEPAVLMGVFNYQKLPMVQDLESALDLIAAHDLIAALAGDESAADRLLTAPGIAPVEIDKIDPDEEHLVHDANSSQHAAINAALAGRHLVVEGPPGTGKSQTIANIIAGAAARGMRVLFVAEKRAAIEAVTGRLTEVNLAELVLDLHVTAGSTKKHVANQLSASLARVNQERPVDIAQLHHQFADRRERLRRYAAELHRIREPWGLSAFDVWTELLGTSDVPETRCRFRGAVLNGLDARTAAQVGELLADFVAQEGLRVLREESPWAHADVRDTADIQRVLLELDNLAGETLHSSTNQMHRLVGQVGLPVPREIAGWQEVLALLDEVATTVAAFGPDVFGGHLDAMWFSTASISVRRAHPLPLTRRDRRALVRQVRAMSRTGLRKKADLHRALTDVRRQRDHWQHLAGPHSRPAAVVGLADMMATYERLRRQLASVALSARMNPLESKPAAEVQRTLDDLRADRDILFRLPRINQLRQWFAQLGLGDLLTELATDNVTGDQASSIFRRAWLHSLDDQFKLISAELREFTPDQHNRFVAEFQDLDRRHREHSAARVRRKVAIGARQARDDHPREAELLRKEAAKKTRHLPLRKLVERAPHVLLALRPCWAMSPLVVSQTLPAQRLFDLVIFDEASQIKPHDAITSIMRGSRLVVAGDEKQLPPSSFFDRSLAETDDDEDADLSDYESILTSLRPVVPQSQHHRLLWHYRSQDERLIAFSNNELYGGDLVTFPGAEQESPIRLEVVEGTVSPGQGGLPVEEVQRVVDLVIEHAEQRPEESLGVITLGVKHQARVEKALREALSERRDLDEFFADDAGPTHRFFVKNIETVQGDERDAIILSVGVARNAKGSVPLTAFGTLNREGTERRVNVAVTRARCRMTIVSSFPPSAVAPVSKVNGTEVLRRYLEAAAAGGDPANVGRATGYASNGFESDITARLAARGLDVYPQWGVAGYRIDLALAHPTKHGQMVLAVEADGDTYHRAASVRDRDRLRQEQLERLGWRFHRVWASAWFANPEKEADAIAESWRSAVTAHDDDRQANATRSARRVGLRTPGQEDNGAEPTAAPAEPEQRVSDRGPRPAVPRGLPIDDYSDEQLIGICWWLICDGLQLDRYERVTQAMEELGFKRRGRRILERLESAIEIAQHHADRTES
ncbi:AAA domain-containing protein [Actinophytocola glycyrrhizae]|uniref:AAA domain-containing protein n=1 Tax=Actinophytocola glycyrrhizae TaxID=2044873 RepID=A0ABV9RZ26_9PSEU